MATAPIFLSESLSKIQWPALPIYALRCAPVPATPSETVPYYLLPASLMARWQPPQVTNNSA